MADGNACSGQDEVIQSLWEGYGAAIRTTAPDGRRCVVKRIDPPAGLSGVAHRRRLCSYAVEAAFYASPLPSLLIEHGVAVALPAPSCPPPSVTSIALTDLTETFPVQRPKQGMTDGELRAAL